ncbi:NAD(P)/FAD-dependent oxidoreductase [Roseibaca sp. Y0-43]|uniref:NAD(P)/FAD-dependent oxidoreductase n=1 Tax=Roseibaca sp. Y0-43 TaxID=2816854 RepID=UPI001D0CC4C3|nr:FAD-dependent oxidoreductase [Roseibaca sp. Y0-43]MCC1481590.1 FAD-dependent oxidoreductase [Roseibaca sp. Y0-43]
MAGATGTIIIGAGITGITCARALAQAGTPVRLLDKGRGIGGRMATKRVQAAGLSLHYDHGAQYIRPRDPAFAAELLAAGASVWGESDRLVGQPGMSSLPRAMADGLDVAQGVEVTGLHHAGGLWHLETSAGDHMARRVVLTIPAPQALALLGRDHPLAPELSAVQMAPCLTLMASFPADSPAPFAARLDPDHPLAWVAQDTTKPDRPKGVVTWVAQASAAFSAQHLDQSPDGILADMLPHLCALLGTAPNQSLHAQVHRWRYAQATQPLGRAFLRAAHGLYVGGDWCLGPRAEDGWASGRAMAKAILTGADAD